jgi:hypothetical protein
MKCIDWYVNTYVGSQKGTGDFECRNCGRIVNNRGENIIRVDGYESQVFSDVDEDAKFDEFVLSFDVIKTQD